MKKAFFLTAIVLLIAGSFWVWNSAELPQEYSSEDVQGPVVDSGLSPKDKVGNALQDNQGHSVSADELSQKKLIGYYFSASWCPPCRAFTPELVKFYQENKDVIEIILVSSDNSADAQLKYMRDYQMPWKALKWGSQEAEALAEHYSITGIPSLIVVDAKGNEITRTGRRDMMADRSNVLQKWLAKASAEKTEG